MINHKQTSHIDSIGSFLAMDIFSRAKKLESKGCEIIHLEFGEPDFSAPEDAVKSVIKSMGINDAGYTFSKGLEGLRNEIVKKYDRDYGVRILPEQVLVSNGTSFLIYLSYNLNHTF